MTRITRIVRRESIGTKRTTRGGVGASRMLAPRKAEQAGQAEHAAEREQPEQTGQTESTESAGHAG
eukprot:374668-Rhodomonas_salina.1